jgi:hypothetical protein
VDIPPGATLIIELDVRGTHDEDAYGITVPPSPFATPDQVEVNLTVAGEQPIAVDGTGVTVDGRMVRWAGPLVDETRIEADLSP